MRKNIYQHAIDEIKDYSLYEIIYKIIKYKTINNVYKAACFRELANRKIVEKLYDHFTQDEFFEWLEKNHPEYLV